MILNLMLSVAGNLATDILKLLARLLRGKIQKVRLRWKSADIEFIRLSLLVALEPKVGTWQATTKPSRWQATTTR
jgi:hypothetical protein